MSDDFLRFANLPGGESWHDAKLESRIGQNRIATRRRWCHSKMGLESFPCPFKDVTTALQHQFASMKKLLQFVLVCQCSVEASAKFIRSNPDSVASIQEVRSDFAFLDRDHVADFSVAV